MEDINVKELLEAILSVSEKAANIARICREDQGLFQLLVEEKGVGKKNNRFVQDFKTLADVLVQETVRHDLGSKFPGIEKCIFGEESNEFTNTLGESITVKITKSSEETMELLMKVLDDNRIAAALLAEAVHTDVKQLPVPNIDDVNTESSLPLNTIGVWIDPIDSTNEYFYGKDEKQNEDSIAPSGLSCVCVLIGVYEKDSGIPIMGVVNQPFAYWKADSKLWSGKCFWGVCIDEMRASSIPFPCASKSGRGVIVTSSSEDKTLVSKLQKKYEIVFTSGAGYKLLCVAEGLADAYVLSKGTTFRWDACAPHALLRSVGGGIVSYQKVLEMQDCSAEASLQSSELTYSDPEVDADNVDRWRNSEGLIGYTRLEALINVVNLIKHNE